MKNLGTLRSAVWVLSAIGMTGCFHGRRPDAGTLSEIKKLAIVAKVGSQPTVQMARIEPREGRAFPSMTPKEADDALQESLLKQVRRFEVQERFRVALLEALPETPPWSTSMSGVEISTALQSLLVEDKSLDIDDDALAARGADAVLVLRIEEYGLRHKGAKAGFFVKGEGELYRIGGGTLWRKSFDLDDTDNAELETVDVIALRDGGYRDALAAFIRRVSNQTAQALAGEHR